METRKTTVELLADLSACVDVAVKAMNDGEPQDKIDAAKEAVDNALGAYNMAATADAYEAWNGHPDPMRAMLGDRYIPGMKKVSYKKDKNSGRIEGKIADAAVKADIVHYQLTCGKAAFADSNWFTYAQKLAYILANSINSELAADPKFSYEVDSAAAAFEFAPDADPASKNSRVKAIQFCVDAIGAYGRIEKADLAYLMNCLTRQGKEALLVSVGSTTKMAELLGDIAYRKINQLDYALLAK